LVVISGLVIKYAWLFMNIEIEERNEQGKRVYAVVLRGDYNKHGLVYHCSTLEEAREKIEYLESL